MLEIWTKSRENTNAGRLGSKNPIIIETTEDESAVNGSHNAWAGK